MSKKHIKLCEDALEEAELSSIRFQHGAIICKSGKIIIKGHNHSRTMYNGKLSPCTHSEMHVIIEWFKLVSKSNPNFKQIQRKGRKCSLYIIRSNHDSTDNIFSNSKPCLMCSLLVKKCNFKQVIYTTGDHQIYNIIKPKDIKLSETVTTSADNQYLKNIDNHKRITNLFK